jgi:hypothetical protein
MMGRPKRKKPATPTPTNGNRQITKWYDKGHLMSDSRYECLYVKLCTTYIRCSGLNVDAYV